MKTGNNENSLFLGFVDEIIYPSGDFYYSPHKEYPEYPFKQRPYSKHNHVYEIVRQGFYMLGYDQINFGKSNWNPLGKFINKGDTVLLKPNWVMHYNKHEKHRDNLDCLLTHPSIVRVVLDYVVIALKGTGKIFVADAPMQGCELDILLEKAGYLRLFDFFKNNFHNIEVLDLRHCRAIVKDKMVVSSEVLNREESSICVDLGLRSYHKKGTNIHYKVSDYSSKRTSNFHHNETHIYKINKNVLQADCLINLPKPKTHRLAGITAAQKNMVGVIYDKSSLPHRIIGSKENGGDEYQKRSQIKKIISILEEYKIQHVNRNNVKIAKLYQFAIKVLYFIVLKFYKEKTMIGSWHGNDTIWRTVADLNNIVMFADKNGTLSTKQQRKILNIADAVIAGQGNGPIGPFPKELGMLIIAEDLSFIDELCATIMGFNLDKIPGLKTTVNDLGLNGIKKIVSNNSEFNNTLFKDFIPKNEWKFEPHEFWKELLF